MHMHRAITDLSSSVNKFRSIPNAMAPFSEFLHARNSPEKTPYKRCLTSKRYCYMKIIS